MRDLTDLEDEFRGGANAERGKSYSGDPVLPRWRSCLRPIGSHEINQPLTAIAANSHTCLHWLSTGRSRISPKRGQAAQRLAKDARRASDIIARIKALMAKPRSERPRSILLRRFS